MPRPEGDLVSPLRIDPDALGGLGVKVQAHKVNLKDLENFLVEEMNQASVLRRSGGGKGMIREFIEDIQESNAGFNDGNRANLYIQYGKDHNGAHRMLKEEERKLETAEGNLGPARENIFLSGKEFKKWRKE